VVGLRFVLVDPYSQTKIKFWCIGATPAQKLKIIEFLHQEKCSLRLHGAGLFEAVASWSKLYGFLRPKGIRSVEAVDVYCPQKENGRLIHGPESGVTIEFPEFSESGDEFVSPTFSAIQRSIQKRSLQNLRSSRLYGCEFLTAPNLLGIYATEKVPTEVDLVYTWVDGRDSAWLARRIRASEHFRDDRAVNDASASFRYHNRNELLYSLRSALTYFLGIRKIYIVTDKQVPPFLKTTDSRIEIVDHEQIFPAKNHLPTFNSHSIETRLHHIPGLGKKYLYLNDDFLFGRPVNPFLFFDEFGRSRFFYSGAVTIPDGQAIETDRGVDAAAKNARDVLARRFGVYVTRRFKHTPVAILKDVVFEMEREFPELFLQTSAARFRSSTDVCVSGSFYFHYASILGRACEGSINYEYLDLHSPSFRSQLKNISRLDTFCINDGVPTIYTAKNELAFQAMMARAFPHPAPFEL
jgi:hypothetical protein